MQTYKEVVAKFKEKNSKTPKTTWRYESWGDSYEQGGRVGYQSGQLVDHGPGRQGYAGKYITGKELEEITGIPNLAVKAKELMYEPKAEKRQKNIFGDFYKKELKAKYIDIGQGGQYGTLHYLKPTKAQIKKIKDYHLRRGAKYGLTEDTIKGMKQFYNDPTLRKYIRKGEFVPNEILKARDIGANKAANITFRLAQHLNGKKFANVDVDLPVNKSVAKKIFKKIEKAPFGNPYQQTAYKESMDIITKELGQEYFGKTNLETMKREARRILNREGVPTFDPTVKGSTGFNINEIIGIKTGARIKGLIPYSQFINVMEGKLNTSQYANFVRQFEKFNNRMQTENKADVIKDYNKYRKTFLKTNPKVKDTDIPKFSLQSPEKVYGKNRITNLTKEGLDLNKSYDEIGYTIDVGKKTRTLKEFITNPKNIGRLKKFGKAGAITAGAVTLPSIVSASESDVTESSMVPKIISENPLKSAAVGTGAALTQKPVRNFLGKTVRALGTPLSGLGFSGWTAYDNLKAGESLADAVIDPLVGGELLFPSLFVENVAKITKSPTLQKVLGLGKFGSRVMPITGTTITLAGLTKDATQEIINESRRIDAIEDSDQQLEEQDMLVRNIKGYADGGRISFGKGKLAIKGIDKGRRAFMKLLAALGIGTATAGAGLIKFGGKAATKTAVKAGADIVAGTPGMPSWFPALVNKIIKEGDDVTEKLATMDRQVVHTKKLPDGEEVTVYRNIDSGDIRVDYDSIDNMGQQPVSLEYRKGEEIYSTGKGTMSTRKTTKEPDTFGAAEAEPVGRAQGQDDYAIEWEGSDYGTVDDLFSDTSRIKNYAEGKKPTLKEIVTRKRKTDEVSAIHKNESDYISTKQGDYDDSLPDIDDID